MARSRMIAQKRSKKFASLCINDLPKNFSAKSAITTNNFFVKWVKEIGIVLIYFLKWLASFQGGQNTDILKAQIGK